MLVIKIIIACAGGFLSRLCGRKSVIPLGLEQWLYALPYGLIFTGSLWGIIPYLAAVAGKRMGHGQYIHLGYLPRQPLENDESIDCIIRFFFGIDRGGNYWRCVAGLAITGLAVTVVPGIVYAIVVNPVTGTLIALSGASKALAYMAGFWAFNDPNRATTIGEILTGVFGWGVIGLVLF